MPTASGDNSTQEQQYDPYSCVQEGASAALARVRPSSNKQLAILYTDTPHITDSIPTLEVRNRHPGEKIPLKEEELILASPILYGFSLSDKIWRTSSSFCALCLCAD